jgi:hypothetical protein
VKFHQHFLYKGKAMTDIDKAAQSADNLLALLIQHQPELIKTQEGGTHEESGRQTAEFIKGLRDGLIDMYNLRARG